METQAKNVRLLIKDEINLQNSHITNMKKVENIITFTYTGEVKELLELLQGKNILDLTITEPTLEEIFMHYYEREEE